jgi:hypothetical protein
LVIGFNLLLSEVHRANVIPRVRVATVAMTMYCLPKLIS